MLKILTFYSIKLVPYQTKLHIAYKELSQTTYNSMFDPLLAFLFNRACDQGLSFVTVVLPRQLSAHIAARVYLLDNQCVHKSPRVLLERTVGK